MSDAFIYPDWPAPNNVKAAMTTRRGGNSLPPYDGFNLGDHVDDNPKHVHLNREQLAIELSLPKAPAWLQQVHGTQVASCQTAKTNDIADAIVGSKVGDVCAIMTADCLPVLFCNKQGTVIGAAHAGWRGLVSGVLEQTVAKMNCDAQDILVWMGAAIGPSAFEVGEEVRLAFIDKHADSAAAFKAQADHKWLADIYHLARIRLSEIKIPLDNIYGGTHCTYQQADDFYSYRRDTHTGRMASLLWLS